ncbi:MAG: hypothetical protein EOO61_04920 [Hymenobacter sp.]|nr:MAG: hypothetical protein EOO61_04920 [Hymenobacter sp.]
MRCRLRAASLANKGEQLHALRVFLWFGGDGLIRRKQEEAQQEVVGALNLVTNLVRALEQGLPAASGANAAGRRRGGARRRPGPALARPV